MSKYCIVVAGGARARFFTLDTPEMPEIESGPNLVELSDLVSVERMAEEKGLWSDSKSGRNRAAKGGPAHGYDDHRKQHSAEYERRFARQISAQAKQLIEKNNSKHLIMVAQKRMQGYLRDGIKVALNGGVKLHELGKDLVKLKPMELHEFLARESLLPARKVASF